MKTMKINSKTDDTKVKLNLSLIELKVLYNACVDILDRAPEMLSYRKAADSLKEALSTHNRKTDYDNKMDLYMITNIALWLGEAAEYVQDNYVEWYLEDGREVSIKLDTKEVYLINFGDDVVYWGVKGILESRDFIVYDAFKEN